MSNLYLLEPNILSVSVTDADKLNKAINHAKNIVTLCTQNVIRILIDDLLYKNISENQICPFPIDLHDVTDEEIRADIHMLNSSFISAVKHAFDPYEMQECSGDQDVIVNSKSDDLSGLDGYSELFSTALAECHNSEIEINSIIVEHNFTKLRNDKLHLLCECDEKKHEREIDVVKAIDLIPGKSLALDELNKIITPEINVDTPIIVKGNHHNDYQTKSFECYTEFNRVNRRVLNLLRKFGLKKIHFLGYFGDSSNPVGNIVKCKYEESEDGNDDLINGWLYTSDDYRVNVILYFPKNVGRELNNYLGSNFVYKEVSDLLTKMKKI